MDHINLVVVGCGYVAEGHLQAWRKVSGASIVAVIDLNEELARETARRWKLPHYYRTLGEALERGDVNVSKSL